MEPSAPVKHSVHYNYNRRRRGRRLKLTGTDEQGHREWQEMVNLISGLKGGSPLGG